MCERPLAGEVSGHRGVGRRNTETSLAAGDWSAMWLALVGEHGKAGGEVFNEPRRRAPCCWRPPSWLSVNVGKASRLPDRRSECLALGSAHRSAGCWPDRLGRFGARLVRRHSCRARRRRGLLASGRGLADRWEVEDLIGSADGDRVSMTRWERTVLPAGEGSRWAAAGVEDGRARLIERAHCSPLRPKSLGTPSCPGSRVPSTKRVAAALAPTHPGL